MIYGHLAVVVFIVLSGFSLAVGPARHGWRLNGLGNYAHRRAWRILSAYWPALVFSMVMVSALPQTSDDGPVTARTAVVYGLLLQDVTGAPSPNGAFWSIAVEAQLYVVLPVMLLLVRRRGLWLMLLAVTVPVLVIGTLAHSVSVIQIFMRFTPQLAVGFAVGVLAAAMATDPRWHRLPLLWLALAAAVPPIALIVYKDSTWTIGHYFWVDLALLPAIGILVAAVGSGQAARTGGVLDVAPIRGLGTFSYSLYLIHAPIVLAVAVILVRPRVAAGVPTLLAMLVIAVPAAIVVSRLFAAAFDLPFQRHKSWSALANAAKARVRRLRGKEPAIRPATIEAQPAPLSE